MMDDEEKEAVETAENPVVENHEDETEEIEDALHAPAATEKTANEAFKSFGKATEPSEIAKTMLEIGKGKNPQIGAIAFLHADEEEALEGYEKALAFFTEDPAAKDMILSIIDDERRHENMLKQLFGMYAAVPTDKEE
jgi:hypothetical protein